MSELTSQDLYRGCDPQDVPFSSTADAHATVEILGQDRAVDAARFAIGMRRDGYNVFALGPEGIGKQTIVRQLLDREAATQPAPSDWCYVHNFSDPHRPRALRMPPGTASRLRAAMERAIAELKIAMPAAFESEEYRTRKHELVHAFKHRQEAMFDALQASAKARRVAVIRADSGVVIAPLRGDTVIESDEFERLPEDEQASLREAMKQVGGELSVMFHTFHDWLRDHVDALKALDREIASSVAHRSIEAIRTEHGGTPAVLAYLDDVERDVVENTERFVGKPDESVPEVLRRALQHHEEDGVRRYEVNVLIDHGTRGGAPVVYEEHPTHANLIGRIEHVSELGALVTEVSLIRAGALHRANGGYLLVDALKLLQQPYAWDALKRALRTHEIRIESLGHALGLVSTVSLEPEPIPLDVKVVLFGDGVMYYLLAAFDPELADLFKVMADFEHSVDRSREANAAYANLIATIASREKLRAFDRGAVARVIEHAARLAGDAQKLSIHLRPIVDLLGEADDVARRAEHAQVTAADVEVAIDAQHRRAGRLRERMLEAIRRDTLLIETRGAVVGQINGLTVVELGAHPFAYPMRITARTRIGGGEVIDIEREVELGGPIHSKGVLILAGLLGARYAQKLPLSLSATIVFEQSYGGVEGDSASLAELCALLSSISEVPLSQALAVTGSVNQLGEVQPIGGVNEKIEGFFDVCRERGLTGDHGVVIPRRNVQHLMLRKDVVDAVEAGRFHIHAVNTVDEALTLLTGREAGVRDAGGHFPERSVNALVEERLAAYASEVRRFLQPEDRGHRLRSIRWPRAAQAVRKPRT